MSAPAGHAGSPIRRMCQCQGNTQDKPRKSPSPSLPPSPGGHTAPGSGSPLVLCAQQSLPWGRWQSDKCTRWDHGRDPLLGAEEEKKPNLTTADAALVFKVLPESPPAGREGFNPAPWGLEDPSGSQCPGERFLTPCSREAPLPTHIFQWPKSSIAQSSAWGTVQEHARDTNTAQDVSINPKAPPHGDLAAPTAPTPQPPPSSTLKMTEHHCWWGWLGAVWRQRAWPHRGAGTWLPPQMSPRVGDRSRAGAETQAGASPGQHGDTTPSFGCVTYRQLGKAKRELSCSPAL